MFKCITHERSFAVIRSCRWPATMARALSMYLLVAAPLGCASAQGGASSTASIPVVSPAPVGSLDKEVIRKIIRGHTDEVRACYEDALAKDSNLFGSVAVEFTIAATGAVIASKLQSATLDNRRVQDCVVHSVQHWTFPKPLGGGIVIVLYPFNFIPGYPIPIVPGANGAFAVDVTFVNRDVLVHRSTDATGVSSNGLVAITKSGLLLVDTSWTEPQTEAILRWGEERLKQHWIGAVITHDHVDRAGGIGSLQRRGIPVAALDLTVAKLASRGVHDVATLFAAESREFSDPRGFEAFYPGPGHASDNIVVSFCGVLFAGCFLKSKDAKDLGFLGAADLGAWPTSVRRLRGKYGRMIIVPGHGPVDHKGEAYEHTLELLRGQR